jgi:hypothetical protein
MKFIIYFIGVLLSYIVGRYVFRHISKKENLPYDWFCVILALAVSSLSLIGVIIFLGVYLIQCPDYSKLKIKKVPKWL